MNIVLIALDTQRADHLGCYGYPKRTSPFIDSIARRGVLYERCYAPNIPTHPSFTTHADRQGSDHPRHRQHRRRGADRATGCACCPRSCASTATPPPPWTAWAAISSAASTNTVTYEWDRSDPSVLRKAETVNAKALPLIEELRASSRPFFLFLHYWDPHTPYLPPASYRQRFYPRDADPYDIDNHSMDEAWSWEPFKWYFHSWMPGVTDAEYVINLYDGETAYMDHHLRRVFRALAPVQQETLVIITADHGEILNEQLGYFDHHGLYEGNVHVPLILYWPGKLPAGRRVPGFVQNLDIAPTLLELAGIPDRDGMEGLSLLPTAMGLRDRNYDELYFSEATWEVKRAIRTARWKLIDSIEPDRARPPDAGVVRSGGRSGRAAQRDRRRIRTCAGSCRSACMPGCSAACAETGRDGRSAARAGQLRHVHRRG